MSEVPDWVVWIFAALVAAMFVWFFWHVGRSLVQTTRVLVTTIQNWPQIRRAMTEAEVRSGGRYPLWYRAVRVLLILVLVALAALMIWRKFAGL